MASVPTDDPVAIVLVEDLRVFEMMSTDAALSTANGTPRVAGFGRYRALEGLVSDALGFRIRLCMTEHKVAPEELTPAGRRRLAGLANPKRRDDWLRGRAALLALAGSDPWIDVSTLQFPNAQWSLSHSGGRAIAARAHGLAGLGIDYEIDRHMDPEAAQWFLTREEAAGASSAQLLRLWTAKEALYKCCPGNLRLGLLDFQTAPGHAGVARCAKRPDLSFRFSSLRFAGGYVSVATAKQRDPRTQGP